MISTNVRDTWLLALIASLVAILVASAPAAAGSGAQVVYSGSRDRPEVALTFDDGWGIEPCRSIFRTLKQKDAAATFFPNGMYVEYYPRFWARVAQRFPIGNHTYSHPSLTPLSGRGVAQEVRRSENVVEAITGVPMIKFLRPPYGAYNDRVRRVAARLGYHTLLMWDTDGYDARSNRTVRRIKRNALRGTNGSIVVLHCAWPETALALPAIIDLYRERGYRLVTVPELLGRS